MNATAQSSPQSIYVLRDVHKHFGSGTSLVRALDGVELTVAEGEFLAIQGPTGQGKSTLLTLLGGLDRPTSGEVMSTARRCRRWAKPKWRICEPTPSGSSFRRST